MTKQIALAWTIGCVGLLGCTEHHVHYHGYDGGEDDATVGRDGEVGEDARVAEDASVQQLEASISSVSLAGDCGSVADAPQLGACAPLPEKCMEEDPDEECQNWCGLPCQQSNMQLSLKIDGIRGSVPVEIVKVELFPTTDDLPGPLGTLAAYEPKVWDGETYGAWDEQLAPGTETKVSYNLTAPDWETIGGGESWQTYSMTFLVRVTLKVNGETITLNSDEIMREPEIVT